MRFSQCLSAMLCVLIIPIIAWANDSLSMPLCEAPNQILMKQGSWSYQYTINGSIVKFDIVKELLNEKKTSEQYLDSYYTLRIIGGLLAITGATCGLVSAVFIEKPLSPLALTGYGLVAIGLGINFSAQGKLKLSVLSYNKDICNGM